MDSETQRARWREDRDRILYNIENCTRDLKRIRWLGLLAISVLPASVFFGPLGALAALVGSGGVVLFAFYLVSGHLADYRARLRAVEKKINSAGDQSRGSRAVGT